MEIDEYKIEALVRETLLEMMDENKPLKACACYGVKKIELPFVKTRPQDRLDTGSEKHCLYARPIYFGRKPKARLRSDGDGKDIF